MDILIVSRCLPWPLHYGDRSLLHNFLGEMKARGHSCDVVAFHAEDEAGDSVERSAALCREIEPIVERPRTPWRYLTRLARPFPRRAADAWSPEAWRAVERRLRSRRYDIVHLFGGVQVYELRELVRVLPAIIVPYESFSLLLERTIADTGRAVERLRLRAALSMTRRYESVMYRGYDRVVVLTAHDREALLRLAPGLPLVEITNGVRLGELPRARAAPPEIVFVGNFDYAPNVRAATILVREVLPGIHRHRPEARVVLVGANPPAEVRALAGRGVDVTGTVPGIEPYLRRAACLVAPITRGAGVKTKILEAMAAAVPVVTTPLGCEGLAVTDAVHLLIRTTAGALSDAALALLDDDAMAGRIGAAGRDFVRMHHSWPRVAARYEQLYEEVIAARSHPTR